MQEISTGLDHVMTINDVIQLVTAGGFGALVWYLIVFSLPKMQTSFEKQLFSFQADLKDQRKIFSESLIEQRKAHLEAESRDREVFRQALKEINDNLISEIKALRNSSPKP